VAAPPPDIDAAFPGKYLSLTTFKRDGTGVATPVWFVVDGGRLLVRTGRESLKVRRLRRNPAVTVAPCTATGRRRGDAVPAEAEVLPDAELERLERLIDRKYRLDNLLLLPPYRALMRLRGIDVGRDDVAVAVTPS
jgi:uncharacterized protein